MSINQIYGINQEKVRRYGKYFGSIDFEVASTNKAVLNLKQGETIAGEFKIGDRSFKCSLNDLDEIIQNCKLGEKNIKGSLFDLTNSELNRIIETCYTAKNTFFQKYRFGL